MRLIRALLRLFRLDYSNITPHEVKRDTERKTDAIVSEANTATNQLREMTAQLHAIRVQSEYLRMQSQDDRYQE